MQAGRDNVPINGNFGQFSAGYWLDPESTAAEDEAEYSDNFGELRLRALRVLAAGRFQYAVLYRLVDDDWEEDEHLTSDDLDG